MSSQRVVFLCGNVPVWEARGQRAEGARINFLTLSPCSSLQLPLPPHVHAHKHANRVLHGTTPRALHVSVRQTHRECLSLQKILPARSRRAHADLSSPAVCLFFLGRSRLCVVTMLVACSAPPHAGVAYDLWMYDWKPLTAEFQVMSLDFSQPPPLEMSVGTGYGLDAGGEKYSEVGSGNGSSVEFVCDGTCHAVVMWLDWCLDRCPSRLTPKHPSTFPLALTSHS
jgi:hypothetical protein